MHDRLVLCASPTFGTTTTEAAEILSRHGARLERIGRDALAEADPEGPLAEASAIIVGTEPVDARTMDAAPALAVVSKHGSGVDNIDLGAAATRGIVVTAARGQNAVAVAEHTLALIFAVARDIPGQVGRVRAGDWGPSVGIELSGSTLGVIGLGHIGRMVAERATALGMTVCYTDVEPISGTEWEYLGLDALLGTADVVTLHSPLTPGTRMLIAEPQLSLMKREAILVNTARGGLIDEAALARALDEGHIRGVGLDVFAEEPPPAGGLRDHPKVVATPHIAAYTGAALARTSVATAEAVAAVLEGRPTPDAIDTT